MRYVIFVCTHNAGRSQIAQAFFENSAAGSSSSPDIFCEKTSSGSYRVIMGVGSSHLREAVEADKCGGCLAGSDVNDDTGAAAGVSLT